MNVSEEEKKKKKNASGILLPSQGKSLRYAINVYNMWQRYIICDKCTQYAINVHYKQ